MTPTLLALWNFFGPIAFQTLLEGSLGRHWAGALVKTVAAIPGRDLSWSERRRLARALSRGFDALIEWGKADPEPLRGLVGNALPRKTPVQVDEICAEVVANVVSTLEPPDRAAWIDARVADIQSSVHKLAGAGSVASELGKGEYARLLGDEARNRRWQDRVAAGLTPEQIIATLQIPARSVKALDDVEPGRAAFVVAPVGSGKSELAMVWLAERADHAARSHTASLPVLLRSDALVGPLQDAVLRQVDPRTVTRRGVEIVLDGLDESADASSLAAQALDFAAKWPRCRVIVTSRVRDVPPGALTITVDELSDEDVTALMGAVTGPRDPAPLWRLRSQVRQAVHRPLFAIFAAQMPQGTSTYELTELMARRSAGSRPNGALKDLAVEIIRRGGAVDPREIPSIGQAAPGVTDKLITIERGRWRFQLPIFLQWFAAQGLLDGTVAPAEYQSAGGFQRWRYVLALAVSGASEHKIDELLTLCARGNPAFASWVIKEVHRPNFLDRRPKDVEVPELARRIVHALDALRLPGPAAPILNERYAAGDVTVATWVSGASVGVQWRQRRGDESETASILPRAHERDDLLWVSDQSSNSYTSLAPWTWSLDRLEKVLRNVLTHPETLVPLDSIIGQEFLHRAWTEITQRGRFTLRDRLGPLLDEPDDSLIRCGKIDITGAGIHALAREPDKWSALGPWTGPDLSAYSTRWVGGNYSDEALLARSGQVLDAAMTAYLDLTEETFAAFGDTLPHRARMPGTWHATIHPPGEQWALLSEWFEPDPTRDQGVSANRLDLRVAARDEPLDPRASGDDDIARAYRQRGDNVPDAKFGLRQTSSWGRFDIWGARPATALAVKWLADDLRYVGRLGASQLRDLD